MIACITNFMHKQFFGKLHAHAILHANIFVLQFCQYVCLSTSLDLRNTAPKVLITLETEIRFLLTNFFILATETEQRALFQRSGSTSGFPPGQWNEGMLQLSVFPHIHSAAYSLHSSPLPHWSQKSVASSSLSSWMPWLAGIHYPPLSRLLEWEI